MSIVTDPARNRIVFCEGDAGSPDIAFWTRILIDNTQLDNTQNVVPQNSFRILIKPMGGKQAAKNFARGYELATSNENWLVIRDRDLDAEVSPNSRIVRWGKIILTGFTCIESYLLEPDLLEQYLKISNLLPQQTITDHQESLRSVFEELRDYQAVRWALQTYRSRLQTDAKEKGLIRGAGQFDLPNRLTSEDGKLPEDLALEPCVNMAIRYIEDFRATLDLISTEDFEAEVDEFLARFDGHEFWTSSFRMWFHGKDVLGLWLQKYKNVSYKEYCRWAVHNVDWTRFDDLREIQKICLHK